MNKLENKIEELFNSYNLSLSEKTLFYASLLYRFSRILFQKVLKNPQFLSLAEKSPYLYTLKPLAKFEEEIKNLKIFEATEKEFLSNLKRYKYGELVRIILKELISGKPEETFSEMTNLAEAIISSLLFFHLKNIENNFGYPLEMGEGGVQIPSSFAIIGMGKLGAMELNISSDIDLVYVYSSDYGWTQGLRKINSQEFFTRLFRNLTQSLYDVTDDGFLFRVDLSLRPGGNYGPLCNSLEGCENYYETFGTTLERMAYLRARVVGGDRDFGKFYIEKLSPFIYRRSLSEKDIDEILKIKEDMEKMERFIKLKKKNSINIKVGEGGIREIEFFANSLQLIYGGKIPQLREPVTMKVIDKLFLNGLINEEEGKTLKESYLFLRKIEHTLQMKDETKIYEFAIDGEIFDLLKERFGFEKKNGKRFVRLLNQQMKNVNKIFSSLFKTKKRLKGGISDDVELIHLLMDEKITQEDIEKELKRLGFYDPEEATHLLKSMRRIPGTPFHPSCEHKYHNLSNLLIDEVLNSTNPSQCLNYLIKLLKSIKFRDDAFDFLLKNSNGRKILFNLFGLSQYLSNNLLKNSNFVYKILSFGAPPPPSSIEEIEMKCNDILFSNIESKRKIIEFHRIKREEFLKTGIYELMGELKVYEVGSILSDITDIILKALLRIILIEEGRGEDVENCGFSVFTLGKYGERAISYSSDLDLILLFLNKNNADMEEIFYSKIARKFLSSLMSYTEEGVLYNVDLRLRPSGSQGTLLCSLSSFEKYLMDGLPLWEGIAYQKFRFICGDLQLKRRAEECVKKSFFSLKIDSMEIKKLDEIRKRYIKELAKENNKLYNIRIGSGGLIDVELSVGLLAISEIKKREEFFPFNTLEFLNIIKEKKLIEDKEYQLLKNAYLFLWKVKNMVQLIVDRPIEVVKLRGHFLWKLSKIFAYPVEKEEEDPPLVREYLKIREYVSLKYEEIFERFLKREGGKND